MAASDRQNSRFACGCMLAIPVILFLAFNLLPRNSGTPAEKAGWVNATGRLYPGVAVYYGDADLQSGMLPLGSFVAFEDHNDGPGDVPYRAARLQSSTGTGKWVAVDYLTTSETAKHYWVRANDPALANQH